MGQLPLQSDLLFFLGYVVNRDFEAAVLEDDAFDDKDTSVFVDVERHALFFRCIGRTFLRLVDKVGYFLKLTDREYLFGSLQILVRNKVPVLCEEVVDEYFLFVFGKYT